MFDSASTSPKAPRPSWLRDMASPRNRIPIFVTVLGIRFLGERFNSVEAIGIILTIAEYCAPGTISLQSVWGLSEPPPLSWVDSESEYLLHEWPRSAPGQWSQEAENSS